MNCSGRCGEPNARRESIRFEVFELLHHLNLDRILNERFILRNVVIERRIHALKVIGHYYDCYANSIQKINFSNISLQIVKC